jgi:hypothetical protein
MSSHELSAPCLRSDNLAARRRLSNAAFSTAVSLHSDASHGAAGCAAATQLVSISLDALTALACQPLPPDAWMQVARDSYKRAAFALEVECNATGCTMAQALLVQAMVAAQPDVRFGHA